MFCAFVVRIGVLCPVSKSHFASINTQVELRLAENDARLSYLYFARHNLFKFKGALFEQKS
jgi:hypothetical protein